MQRDQLLVNLQTCKFDVVHEVAKFLGYEEADEQEEGWDLCWSDLSVSVERVSRLRPFQRLNHFPGMLEVCRKAALSRHMGRMASRLPEEYDFYPMSLNLPDQLTDLLDALKKNKVKLDQGLPGVQTFILKPSSGTMGRGIHMVQTVPQLSDVDISNVVAQAYIANPLLVDGFKFDMRIYALVMSVDPLKIYLYDEGLARLATVPYQPPNPDNLNTSTMHLTNYSVNKNSSSFMPSESSGTKRPASAVLKQIAERRGYPMDKIVSDISQIIVKTIMAIQPLLAHTYHTAVSSGGRAATCQRASCPCLSLDHISTVGMACTCPPSQCFELLGFDIMLDDKLKPWLIEVNHSPSFACDARIDKQVKFSLLADTLVALDQSPEDKTAYNDAQQRALSERLYAPHALSSSGLRRPLSSVPKSKQLRAATAALDELINTTSSTAWQNEQAAASTSNICTSSGNSASGAGQQSVVERKGVRMMTQLQQSQYQNLQQGVWDCLGPGFMKGRYVLPGNSDMGRYNQIYPHPTGKDRSMYLKILATASDAFADQRCGCAWCARRLRVRHMASTALEIYAATGNQRHRPFSASLLGNLSGARPKQLPVRSVSHHVDGHGGGHGSSTLDTGSSYTTLLKLADEVVLKGSEPGEGPWSGGSSRSSSNASTSSCSLLKPPPGTMAHARPPRSSAPSPLTPTSHQSGSPLKLAQSAAGAGGRSGLESYASLRSEKDVGLSSERAMRHPGVDSTSGGSGHNAPCQDEVISEVLPHPAMHQKMERQLARYLKVLHCSSHKYQGSSVHSGIVSANDLNVLAATAQRPGSAISHSFHLNSNIKNTKQDREGQPAITTADGSINKGGLSEPSQQTSSRPQTAITGSKSSVFIPRVARLGSARSASQRRPVEVIDPELLAMRIKTAAMLSNRFVSCYTYEQGKSSFNSAVRDGFVGSDDADKPVGGKSGGKSRGGSAPIKRIGSIAY